MVDKFGVIAAEHEYWMREMASQAWEQLMAATESTVDCPMCGVSYIPEFDTHECHNKAPWWEQDSKGTNIPWELSESSALLAESISLFPTSNDRKYYQSNKSLVTKDLHLICESAI